MYVLVELIIIMQDVILLVVNKLRSELKINFIETCKTYNNYKHLILFNDKCNLVDIVKTSYFNNFTNIFINSTKDICFPKNINRLECSVICQMPNTIRHLVFNDFFDNEIKNCIPNSVVKIVFGECFNQDIKGCIPNSVRYLEFGYYYNKNLEYCIPNTVTQLVLGSKFNQDIDNCIPNSLTHLTFGYRFNKSINNLPETLTHLILGEQFHQKIENCLPKFLLRVTFGVIFNHKIEPYLPNSLRHLAVGDSYNKKIRKLPNITHLILGNSYNKNTNNIPQSVTHLTINNSPDCDEHGYSYRLNFENKYTIPNFIRHLTITGDFDYRVKKFIPASVTHLYLKKILINENINNLIPVTVICVMYRNMNIKRVDANTWKII